MKYFENNNLNNYFKRYQAFIFDMNGLIIDDEPIQFMATSKSLKRHNIKIDEKYWIDFFVGRKLTESLNGLFIARKIHDLDVYDVVREKNLLYLKLLRECCEEIVRPGILSFVDFVFKEKSQILGLCSSATQIEINCVLNLLKLETKFDFLICGDDVKRAKPHPDIYLKCSKAIDVSPNLCLAFEDSEAGVASAFSAGLSVIAMPNNFTKHQNFNKANLVFDTLNPNPTFYENSSRI